MSLENAVLEQKKQILLLMTEHTKQVEKLEENFKKIQLHN